MTEDSSELILLDPDHVIFPDPRQALSEPDGLLAVGGNLRPDTLIKAYSSGIFPWYEQGQPLLWWSPNPRAVVSPEQLHISKSLRKTLRAGRYEISTDRAFSEVIRACAGQRHYSEGTWITEAMIQAYIGLFELGIAHSVECWIDGQLAGGLYGVAVGGVFCGESMFSLRPNASKIALAHLARALNDSGFALIDCQVGNDHLFSLGAVMIDRDEFLDLLQNNVESKIIWPGKNISAKLFTGSIFDDKS
jgi:leucyl/phenylalanyl-tRNA--protein transferase